MYSKPILTDKEYTDLKARYEKYEEMRKQVCKFPNCVDLEEQKILSPWHVENDDISRMEVYEFVHDIPSKYFSYVHMKEKTVTYSQTHTWKVPSHITTWTGEVLGTITDYGPTYKTNFGDYRIAIRVTAINGKRYYGTFYKSAGDYCRLTMCKD